MVMPNQRRRARLFTAITTALLCAAAALAQPVPPPPMLLAQQPFAAVVFADNNVKELLLSQQNQDYEGCVALKVYNNVPLNIIAAVEPAPNSDLPNAWLIKLNEPGEHQNFVPAKTSNKILAPHEPGEGGSLELCVKVQGVDPKWHAGHQGLTKVQVARIVLTIMPNI